MRRRLRLALLLGAVLSAAPMAWAEEAAPAEAMPVRFTAPAGWRLQTDRGAAQSYRSWRFVGPCNQPGTYSAYISVRELPLHDAGGAYATLEEWAQVMTNSLADGAEIESRWSGLLGSERTEDITVLYPVPPLRLHGHGTPEEPVPVRTRTICVQRGSRLYELTLSADAREYAQYTAPFDELLSSWTW